MHLAIAASRVVPWSLPVVGYLATLGLLRLARRETRLFAPAGFCAFVLSLVSLAGLFISWLFFLGVTGENTEPTGWYADPGAWQHTAQFVAAGIGTLTTIASFLYICTGKRDRAFAAALLATVSWAVWLAINIWLPGSLVN